MKKTTSFILLFGSIFTLVACENNNIAKENSINESSASSETIDKYEYYLDDNSNISAYFDVAQDKNVIVDVDKEISFTINGYAPEIIGVSKMDIDDNQTEEYVVTICEGRGTGCYVTGLAIIEGGQEQPVFYLSSQDIAAHINERLSYKYSSEYSVLSVNIDNKKTTEIFMEDYLKDNQNEYERVFECASFGDIIYVENKNGELWISGCLGLYFDNMASPQFEPSIRLSAPIVFSEGYNYSIGEIEIKVLHDYYNPCEPDEYSEIISEFSADITHNGYDDQILLTVPKGNTLDEVKSGVCGGQLYVLERYSDGVSKLYSVKREFSTSHVGNGQLFVTTVNDRDYLVETNFWAGQGSFTYSYEVFFEDYFTKYLVDSDRIEFEGCEKPGDTSTFFNNLNQWINESTYVLYAADINCETDLIYSTEKNKISPKEYLQYKSNQ